MIAGDIALEWALDRPDVAVFWNAQQPGPTETKIGLAEIGLSTTIEQTYHIALERGRSRKADLASAPELAKKIMGIEEPSTHVVQEYLNPFLASFLQKGYVPERLKYLQIIGGYRQEVNQKTALYLESLESSLVTVTGPVERNEDLQTKQGSLFLMRIINIYPEASVAHFHAALDPPALRPFASSVLLQPRMLRKIRESYDKKVDIERARTTGLAAGTPNKTAPVDSVKVIR